MDSTIFRAFVDELDKIATAFNKTQYKKMYGPKMLKRDQRFPRPGEPMPNSQFQSLTPNNETYSPISSSSRVLEGRETPGGPL